MPTIFDLMNNSRNIYLFDAIFPWTSQSVIKDLISMDKDSEEEINIFVNSPGGRVSDALAIIDVMKVVKSPVNTIVLGIAASAGSLISSQGDKRYISENSELMIHEAAMQGFDMNTRDGALEKAMTRLDEINAKMSAIYSNKSKKSLSEVTEILSSKNDIYMNAKESIEFGLVDAVLTQEEMAKIKLSEVFAKINLSEKFSIESSEDDQELKKVHLLKCCSLKDRGVEITKDTLTALKSNFDANVRGQDISIDYTHENDSGEKKAGAWIKEMIIEDKNLYAMLDFTPTAKQMIKDKEYKYLSVEIDPFYSNEDGKTHINVLLGGTFTNRPAVKGLEPIKLSENINKNKIDMILAQEEIASIEAIKKTGIEIKDFHSSFVTMQQENSSLKDGTVVLEAKNKELEDLAKSAQDAVAKIEEEKIKSDKLSSVEALIETGIIANSQKEKVIAKFSSKSEIEDFYKGVPASIKVAAKGSDLSDGGIIDNPRDKEIAKLSGVSIEEVRAYKENKKNK